MMKILSKIAIVISVILMLIFFSVKTSVLIGLIQSSPITRWTEFISFISFVPIFYFLVKQLINKNKEILDLSNYSKKLNQVLVSQSHNTFFYLGEIKEGGKILTKKVTETLDTDRCSIWLYNKYKTSIVCQQLYIKSDDKWIYDSQLHKEHFKPYFDYLEFSPVVIADDAEIHPATSCFAKDYLIPLGIKSMLDVPIIYKGDVIGVICIESYTKRKWKSVEVNFSQILSSIYSFAYSIKQTNRLSNDLFEVDKFIDFSALVSKADSKGKITYVNKKFEDVSGWKLEEVIGKDHKIVNSGTHPKEFWNEMYKKVIKEKEIWNSIVTNKTKKGEIYWVDSFIKGEFDEDGKLTGFMSIRYDISDVIRKNKEIENKNTYLEHASKIIRHDMHSGINTYIPRGLSSLERRLTSEDIEKLKIESPLKMIKEGLIHTQKVYKGVYEFTNLVKKDAVLNKQKHNIKNILDSYLSSTSYKSQVIIDDIGEFDVNESLFCTAIDNLIRNGLKYNDSETKFVKLFLERERISTRKIGLNLIIQDNGRGMTQEEFENLSKPYVRKEGQKESGSGLGLNICAAILQEHGFKMSCEKNEIGTKMKIKLK